MKPFRNIVILVLVIALLGGGLYFVTQYEPKTEDTSLDLPDTVTIFKTEKDRIQAVKVTNPQEEYVLSKTGEDWVINGDASIKVSVSRIETLLYECANVVAQKLVGEHVTDLSVYGLDQPTSKVQITLNDGTTATILIGNASLEGSVSYIMVAGDDKVYTKSTSGCRNLASLLSDLADKEIYSMAEEELGGFFLNRKDALPVRIVLENRATDGEEPSYQWEMKEPIEKVANDYTINESVITNLVVQSAVEVIPIPEAGKAYGFDAPQATYGIWSRDHSKSFTITVGKSDGENTYLTLQGDPSVYLVATENLDFLKYGYLDLVDKLVHIENINDVSEVLLTGLGKEYVMAISDSKDAATYTINGKSIEESKFKKAYQSVLNLVLTDFVQEQKAGKAAFTILYKKKDGTQTSVQCTEYDDRNYLVLVNGKGNLLIRKKQVDNMIQVLESTLSE